MTPHARRFMAAIVILFLLLTAGTLNAAAPSSRPPTRSASDARWAGSATSSSTISTVSC